MWERLRAWLGEVADGAEDPRWRAGELPVLLAAVLDAPDSAERRAVYADWLVEQADPLGELINLELALGPCWAVDRRYAELLPRVLGDLAPVFRPWAFAWGLPVEGFVAGGRPDLLAHPQWSAVRHVQAVEPAVCGALARWVPSFHVVGWPAFEALAAAPESVVRRVVLDATGLPDRVPEVRFDTLALRGVEPARDVVVRLLDSPLRELRVHTHVPPDPDLRKRLAQHPTLERYVWRGGHWGADGPVPPLPRPWSHPRGLPAHLLPVRQVGRGANRRLWLVHDTRTGTAATAAIVEGSRAPVTADTLRPIAVIGQEPEIELYPPDLEPLGPRPWTPSQRALASDLVSRVQLAADGPLDRSGTLSQLFRRADGSLTVVAPPERPADGRLPPALELRGGAGWAGLSVRGPRGAPDETGLIARPSTWALVEADSPWSREGTVGALVDRLVAEAPSPLDDLLADALERPWEQFGAASMVALSREGTRFTLAWLGEAQAWAVSADRVRLLTVDHTLPPGGEPDDVDSVAAPMLVGSLGVGSEGGFERTDLVLRPGERVLLCTASIGRHLDAGVLATVLRDRAVHDAVAALIDAYCSVGAAPDAACLLVDPVRAGVPEAP
ncbi:MAG: TIGR02996 domain-containing protein [Alphaproteobacteria bacterium]|nr:TIGR02996 domain-containing protein [Alphaproteobacteria bacterium]